MHRWQAANPGRVEMLTRTTHIGNRGFHLGHDGARPVMGGDIDADVFDGVSETETDWRRLRQRFSADLADHFLVVDDVAADVVTDVAFEEEHDFARPVRAVPPPAGNSGRSMCPHRQRAYNQTRMTAQRTKRARVVDGLATVRGSFSAHRITVNLLLRKKVKR